MKHIHFFYSFLLIFLLSGNTFFCSEKPLYAIAATFDANGENIALLLSDYSLKIATKQNDTFSIKSYENIQALIDKKKVHSITYSQYDTNNIEITIHDQSDKPSIPVTKNLVKAKKLLFNTSTSECRTLNIIKNFPENQLSHNSIDVITSHKTAIRFNNNIPTDVIVFKNDVLLSCTLNAHNINNPMIIAGFKNHTRIYELKTSKILFSLAHEGTRSTALAFSSDGSQCALCNSDGSIELHAWKNIYEKPITINLNHHDDNSLVNNKPVTPGLLQWIQTYINITNVPQIMMAVGAITCIWLYYTKYLKIRI